MGDERLRKLALETEEGSSKKKGKIEAQKGRQLEARSWDG